MKLRHTLSALAACGIAALAIAAPAGAGSIVFLKDGNVWLTSPDGSKQYEATFDGGYDSPSQADDGTIVALRNKELVLLDRSGRRIGHPVPGIGSPGPGGGDSFFGPYEPRVSPDATKIAYWLGQYSEYFSSPCNCYLFRREEQSTWTWSDRLVTGSIEAEGAAPTSFTGWIELATVVAELRSSAQAPAAA